MIPHDQFQKAIAGLTSAANTLKEMQDKQATSEPSPVWIIDKQIDFCYGHRVWSQQLERDFCSSDDYCTKCRHLHGHQGEVHVFLEAPELERGMVTDFKHLGWFKDFIDDNVDHKFILDLNDPWFAQIINAVPEYHAEFPNILVRLNAVGELNTKDNHQIEVFPINIPGLTVGELPFVVGYKLDVSDMSGPEREFFEGFILVDFLPTSENLAKWMYNIVKTKMDRLDVKVNRVTLNETPKSRADYSVVG